MRKCLDCDKDLVDAKGPKKRCDICNKEYRKLYWKARENNPKRQEQNKNRTEKFRKNNPHKISEYSRKYRYGKNRENYLAKKRERNKEYYKKNKEIIMEKQKNRRKNDPIFKFRGDISTLIRNSLSRYNYKKNTKTENILGCSVTEFKKYIESLFDEWMNWDNRGLYNGELNYGWDLDHIIPISFATNEEEIIKLNHYTNFQPLCSYTNRNIKKDKIKKYLSRSFL